MKEVARNGLSPSIFEHPSVRAPAAFGPQDLLDWEASLVRRLGAPVAGGYAVEPKLDGASLAARYRRGRLVQLVTRGNGTGGEDVSHAIGTITGLPRELATDASFEVGGEVLLTTEQFERANAIRAEHGAGPFSNPRNGAAGTLRAKGRAYTVEMSFWAFGAVELDGGAALSTPSGSTPAPPVPRSSTAAAPSTPTSGTKPAGSPGLSGTDVHCADTRTGGRHTDTRKSGSPAPASGPRVWLCGFQASAPAVTTPARTHVPTSPQRNSPLPPQKCDDAPRMVGFRGSPPIQHIRPGRILATSQPISLIPTQGEFRASQQSTAFTSAVFTVHVRLGNGSDRGAGLGSGAGIRRRVHTRYERIDPIGSTLARLISVQSARHRTVSRYGARSSRH